VICDNARFHDCRAVRQYLAKWAGRIELHYLPKYAPETNPIERVWWHLHETITRNHRCSSINELVAEVYAWAETHNACSTSKPTTSEPPINSPPSATLVGWNYLD